MLRIMNRPNPEHWNEFVAAIKCFPILWGIRFKQSGEGRLRERAMQELLPIYQKIEPSASLQRLRQRLSGIRASHRREWRRERLAQREGRTYKSSLWYYEQLRFLWSDRKGSYKWNEKPDELFNAEGEDVLENENYEQESVSEKSTELETEIASAQECTNTGLPETAVSLLETKLEPAIMTTPRAVVTSTFEPKSEPLEMPPNREAMLPCNQDEAAIYAASWATAFRRMNVTQQIYAKRAIEEILALGQLRTLSWNSAQQAPQNMRQIRQNMGETRQSIIDSLNEHEDSITIKLEFEPENHINMS